MGLGAGALVLLAAAVWWRLAHPNPHWPDEVPPWMF